MATGTSQHRLAVILHADVVGSTRLVRQDERVAHDRIQTAFQHFSKAIDAYGGVVNEIRGDALVAEFARASDAVLAALSAHLANRESNAGLDDDIVPELRVGIALGEVVIANDTVTGAGVVLAQRLEQLAAPGGIAISEAVHEAVPDRLPLEYSDFGSRQAKGFDELVHAYSVALKQGEELPAPEQPASTWTQAKRRWLAGAVAALLLVAGGMTAWLQPWKPDVAPTSVEGTKLALPDKPSVAVLPFENMSNDAGQEYFSDGLTEDIITDLARISGLFVIARNSSFAYKGQSIDMRQVGRELGVRYLVEGSVRKAQGRVRVTAQLIDVESGMHVWADRYDRDLHDVFALQDELTRTIVDALAVNLTEEETEVLTRSGDTSLDSYDVLLRGHEQLARFSPDANAEARELFHKAIALNQRYARAHANLALTYAHDASFGWTDDREESIRLGLAAAEEASRLDDRLPQLHYSLAQLYGADLRWDEAAIAARHSLELEPNYADGAGILAAALTRTGDLDGAIAAIEKTKRLNPRYSNIVLQVEGRILYFLGRYDEAAQRLEEAVQRNPEFHQTRVTLAATFAQLGRSEDAEWETEEILTLQPDFAISTYIRGQGFLDEQLAAHYAEGLRKAGLPE